MKLDGKQIASDILGELRNKVEILRKENIIPTLLVVLVGNNEQSIAYIKQKELKAAEIGARTEVLTFDNNLTFETAKKLVEKSNADPLVHGLIIQRPAPDYLRVDELSKLIDPKKEIDGFGENSPYIVPVAEAIEVLLRKAFEESGGEGNFENWIKKKNLVVMGKGETAGGPIIIHLKKLGINPQVIDSKTENPKDLTKNADILISAVGKDKAVTPEMLKKGVILIGVGLHTDEEGKLRGDFHADEIRDIVSFYSPTPGGVGPVNVASLMRNLVKSARLR